MEFLCCRAHFRLVLQKHTINKVVELKFGSKVPKYWNSYNVYHKYIYIYTPAWLLLRSSVASSNMAMSRFWAAISLFIKSSCSYQTHVLWVIYTIRCIRLAKVQSKQALWYLFRIASVSSRKLLRFIFKIRYRRFYAVLYNYKKRTKEIRDCYYLKKIPRVIGIPSEWSVYLPLALSHCHIVHRDPILINYYKDYLYQTWQICVSKQGNPFDLHTFTVKKCNVIL